MSKNKKSFYRACKKNDINRVMYLIEQPTTDAIDPIKAQRGLRVACERGRIRICEYLLKKRSNGV